MTDKDILNNSLSLLAKGRKREALPVLMNLIKKTQNDYVKLQSILAIIPAKDPIVNDKYLNTIVEEGLRLALKRRDYATLAYLKSQQALLLNIELTGLGYEKNNLKLVPGWIGFSTEVDSNKYKELSIGYDNNAKEIDRLLDEGFDYANKSNNNDVKIQLLIAKGEIYSLRSVDLKLEYTPQNNRVKYSKYYIVKYLRLHDYIAFTKEQRKRIKEFQKICIDSYLEAAKLSGSGINAAYAYYNLANAYNTAFMFIKARRYLFKAKLIAQQHNEIPLLKSINNLEKIIKERNTNIPDYVSGETRDLKN